MSNNIFVIGAKPNAIFPDVKPDKIYAANGGMAVAQRYIDENVYFNGVLSKSFLSRRRKDNKALAPTIAVLHGCHGHRLIVAGGGPKIGGYDSPEQRGMTFDSIQEMSRFESFLLKLRYMKYRRFFDKVDCKGQIDWVRNIRKTRDLPAMSLAYAPSRVKSDENRRKQRWTSQCHDSG